MVKFLIILFIFTILVGCNSSQVDNSYLYYIEKIDSTEYPEHYFIVATSNSKFFYILSKKESESPCNNLKEHTYYKLYLNAIQTPIKVKIRYQKENTGVYIGNEKFYENGHIVGKVYSSSVLKGLCINSSIHYP